MHLQQAEAPAQAMLARVQGVCANEADVYAVHLQVLRHATPFQYMECGVSFVWVGNELQGSLARHGAMGPEQGLEDNSEGAMVDAALPERHRCQPTYQY